MNERDQGPCPNCGVNPGQLHRLGCDVEQCPDCGMQLLSCPHFLFGTVKSPPDVQRMPWTGTWPGEQECREFDWYDSAGEPDLNRLRKETSWDAVRKRYIRKEDHGQTQV
jgi:hypothetical protein